MQGCEGALDANLFHLIGGLTNACSVDETEGNTLDVDGVFDGVARGAMDVGDNGAVVFQKAVQKGGFAYIGFANNSNWYSLLDGLTGLERVS